MSVDTSLSLFTPDIIYIEGSSEDAVYNAVDALGYSKDKCTTRDVEGIYLDYGFNLKEIYDLKLEEERK